jgi:hypothetical protein
VFPCSRPFTVGIFAEGLQRLVPRVLAKLHDVLLNRGLDRLRLRCSALGLTALMRAVNGGPILQRSSSLAVFASVVIAALAGFFPRGAPRSRDDDPQTVDLLFSRYSRR